MTVEIQNARRRPARPLDVPALWCPFPESRHPLWKELDEGALAWLSRFELTKADAPQDQRLSTISCGDLGGRVTEPQADRVFAQFGTDSLMWLFAFDDAYCDEGAYSHDPAAMAFLVAETLRTAETGTLDTVRTPEARALCDLRNRLESIGDPSQVSRWIAALRNYLGYQVWEAAHRARHTVPTLDGYLAARISSGSMPVCTALQDVVSGFAVSDEDFNQPVVRALDEMCCLLVGIDNDLLSHWKESLRSGDGLNVVDVWAEEHGHSQEEVLPDVIALRNEILHRYLRIREQAWTSLGPNARRFIGGLDRWIRGNLDWSLGTRRYLHPENPARNPSTLENIAPPSSSVAPPFPSLAWWWDPRLTP